MSRPGRVQALPAVCTDGIDAGGDPTAPGAGMLAVLLTLLDAHTQVHLAAGWATPALQAYLRFYSGVAVAAAPEQAAYVASPASALAPALWQRLDLGSDEAPQRGATLLVQVDALGDDGAHTLRLQGPGIASRHALGVSGVPVALWRWRASLAASLPCGFDLVLVCGSRVAAIARSTRVQWEP
jgi:alpha-D-ribose 1-methylphosphonate 5-triphosphate synthase subunit PhnH